VDVVKQNKCGTEKSSALYQLLRIFEKNIREMLNLGKATSEA